MSKWTFPVPKKLMVEIGNRMTQETKKCADTWDESKLQLARAYLGPEYVAVPTDQLGIQWRALRKNAQLNYVEGSTSTRGRKRLRKRKTPKGYHDYINSCGWKNRRPDWLDFWKACCLCKSVENLQVHHNTYERCNWKHPGRDELFTDCVVLCEACHVLHELNMPYPPEQIEVPKAFQELFA